MIETAERRHHVGSAAERRSNVGVETHLLRALPSTLASRPSMGWAGSHGTVPSMAPTRREASRSIKSTSRSSRRVAVLVGSRCHPCQRLAFLGRQLPASGSPYGLPGSCRHPCRPYSSMRSRQNRRAQPGKGAAQPHPVVTEPT